MSLLWIAGWSSPVARQAHNLKVLGSNPSPATNSSPACAGLFCNQMAENSRHQSQASPKNCVCGNRHKNKPRIQPDVEHLRVRSKQHPQLQPNCKQYRPRPVTSPRITDQREIHHPKRRAVTEMVEPTNHLSRQTVCGLFKRFPQDHRTETREDFEQFHWWHNGFDAPLFGEDKRQTKNIISHRRNQSTQHPDPNGTPDVTRTTDTIRNRNRTQYDERRRKNVRCEKTHRTKPIEIREQTCDGR